MRYLILLICLTLLAPLLPLARAEDKLPPHPDNPALPVLFHTTFSAPEDLKKFTFTDPAAWKLAEDKVSGDKALADKPANPPADKLAPVLSLFQQSKYKPAHRSPVNIAWINDLKVSEFVMEIRCRTTQKPIPNRDVCFFFGHADAAHFLYAHLAQKQSANHNDLFVVSAADRAPISTHRSEGTPWTEGYHIVKIIRTADTTKVYFDNQLMLATESKSLPTGGLGIGSFDDTANFAEITVWGKN